MEKPEVYRERFAIFTLGNMIVDASGKKEVTINEGEIKRLYLGDYTDPEGYHYSDVLLAEKTDGTVATLDDMVIGSKITMARKVKKWLLAWRDHNPVEARKVDEYM